MTQQDVINEALSLIYEKTGIVFNPENVITDYNDNTFRRKTNIGVYHRGNDKVYIRPHYVEDWTDRYDDRIARHHQFYNQEYKVKMQEGIYNIYTEDEYVALMEDICKSYGPHRAIIHEIGHWVHDWYFNNKPMYVPEAPRGHASLNHSENFATAFQEFVQGDLDPNSKRYKRMYRIITKELPETEYWKTHNVT